MKKNQLHSKSETFLAQWLNGELTNEQLKNIVSESDFKTYLKLKRGLEVKSDLDRPIKTSYTKIKQRISQKENYNVIPLYKKWFVGIAASLLIMFGLFKFSSSNSVIEETSYGEQRTVELLDGSEVILNSKSKITYDKKSWNQKRELRLVGEAFFKVEKGEKFSVITSNGIVNVLGTEFNVISKKNYFDVICYEGKVSVDTNKDNYILLPSNGIRVRDNKPLKISNIISNRKMNLRFLS